MPRRVIFRLVLALLVGVGLWAPATPAAAADPCCSVQLGGVPASFTAGMPAQFGAALHIALPAVSGQQSLRNVSAALEIQAPNLTHDQIQFAWHRQNGDNNWHNVGLNRRNGALVGVFLPYQNRQNFGDVNVVIRLQFGSKVTAQNITIGMVMDGRAKKGGEQQLAQSSSVNSAIVAVAVTPTPTLTPTPTPTLTPTPSATPSASASAPSQAPSSASVAPSNVAAVPAAPAQTDDPAPNNSGLPWILYIVGGLLLLGGIAIIGTMLWKRGASPVATDWTEPHGFPPSDPYPPQNFGPQGVVPQIYPTQVYGAPAVPPPATYLPPPAPGDVGGTPPLDPTKQFPQQ